MPREFRIVRFDLNLTPTEHAELRRLSRETGVTMSNIIRTAIREYAQKRERRVA